MATPFKLKFELQVPAHKLTSKFLCFLLLGRVVLFSALNSQAALLVKANNTDALNLASSWTNNAVPTSADIAQWDTNVTSASPVSLGAAANWVGLKILSPGSPITINAGNTLTLGASGADLSLAAQGLNLNCALVLGANQSWSVTNGRTLTVGNAITGTALLTLPGSGTVTLNGGAVSYTLGTTGAGNNALALNGGSLNLSSGTLTLNGNNSTTDAVHLNGDSVFNQSGGIVNSAFYTRLGSGASGTSSLLLVSGGTFNNSGEILFGYGGSGGSGTLTVTNSGVVSMHFLRLGDSSSAGTHTVNLDGGTLKTDRIYRNNATPVFNFNGGLLQVNGSPSSPWFQASVANVYVKNGGARIDTTGHNVTLEPGMQPASGSTGGLTKLGVGILTLTGTNIYAGATAISNDTLTVNGRLNGTGTVTVYSGATLGGTGVVAGAVSVLDGATLAPGAGQFTVGSLMLSAGANVIWQLGAAGSATNSSLKVNGNLVLDGVFSATNNGGMSTGAVYSVINYTGALTNLGMTVDPKSPWDMAVDTSVTNFVKLTATRKFPFLEITNGNFAVSTTTTNLGGLLHGTPTLPLWYEVRDQTNRLWDYGATPAVSPWSITVRHLRAGTSSVTIFAEDSLGNIQSNRVQLTLTLGANPSVRPRPQPAEIWWGGSCHDNLYDANTNIIGTYSRLSQLTQTNGWDFVKRYADGFFLHGYVWVNAVARMTNWQSVGASISAQLAPFNGKYWLEDGWQPPTNNMNYGHSSAASQASDAANLLGIGLALSEITEDFNPKYQNFSTWHPDWPTNDIRVLVTGNTNQATPAYPYASGLWRDHASDFHANRPDIKFGWTWSPVWFHWLNGLSLGTDNGIFTITSNGTNYNFDWDFYDYMKDAVAIGNQTGVPFAFASDCPWDYYGKNPSNPGGWSLAQQLANRVKIRSYEVWLRNQNLRHTLICNYSQMNSTDTNASDLTYEASSLSTLYLHQQEGGRASRYSFESWYQGPYAVVPETQAGSYTHLALTAIKYLKGIADTNGALEKLTLTLLSTNGGTNTITLTNRGDVMCLPAIAAFETGTGAGTVTYYDARSSNITSAILSPEGWVYTNQLAAGQGTTIRVVPSVLPLNRTVTLEAFWNPQDPTGVVRDRLVLTPPNTPPILNAISNRTLIAGQTLTVTNTATDTNVPAQTLVFNLLTSPAGMILNSTNGLLTWRPTISQSPTTNPVSVVVADNGVPPMSATQAFTVFVLRPATPALTLPTLTNGVFNLRVTGDSGPDYILLGATDLSSPVIWLPLQTNVSAVPPFTFSDPATNAGSKFYRVQIAP